MTEEDYSSFHYNFNHSSSPKPLIFFINGVGESSEVWRHQISHLNEKGQPNFSFDFIGHGKTPIPKGLKNSFCCDSQNYMDLFTFEAMYEDALHFLDFVTKEGKKPVYLVTHSYGCMIGLKLAYHRRDIIQRVILAAPGSPYPLLVDKPKNLDQNEAPAQLLVNWLRLPYAFSFPFQILFKRMVKRLFFHKEIEEEVHFAPLEVFRAVLIGQNDQGMHKSFFEDLNQSFLVLHGEFDKLISKSENQIMLSELKQAKFRLIKNTGHAMMLEDPDFFNSILDTFLQ